MSPRLRHAVITALKLATTVGLLWWLSRAYDLRSVLGELDAFAPSSLLAAGALAFAAAYANMLRWRFILARLDVHVGQAELFGDTLVGVTYSMLLPSSIGGDAVRAIRVGGRSDAGAAWASILYERVVGFMTLGGTSVVGLLFLSGSLPVLLVALAALAACVALLLFGGGGFKWVASLVERRFVRVAVVLERISDAFQGEFGQPRVLTLTMLLSLSYQAVGLSILGVLAYSRWGAEALPGIYLGVPLVLVLSALPVSLGNLGFRESLFVVLLAPWGIDPRAGLTLGVLWLASSTLLALTGAGLLAVEALRGRPPITRRRLSKPPDAL